MISDTYKLFFMSCGSQETFNRTRLFTCVFLGIMLIEKMCPRRQYSVQKVGFLKSDKKYKYIEKYIDYFLNEI